MEYSCTIFKINSLLIFFWHPIKLITKVVDQKMISSEMICSDAWSVIIKYCPLVTLWSLKDVSRSLRSMVIPDNCTFICVNKDYPMFFKKSRYQEIYTFVMDNVNYIVVSKGYSIDLIRPGSFINKTMGLNYDYALCPLIGSDYTRFDHKISAKNTNCVLFYNDRFYGSITFNSLDKYKTSKNEYCYARVTEIYNSSKGTHYAIEGQDEYIVKSEQDNISYGCNDVLGHKTTTFVICPQKKVIMFMYILRRYPAFLHRLC